jgi:hypothetical protein
MWVTLQVLLKKSETRSFTLKIQMKEADFQSYFVRESRL